MKNLKSTTGFESISVVFFAYSGYRLLCVDYELVTKIDLCIKNITMFILLLTCLWIAYRILQSRNLISNFNSALENTKRTMVIVFTSCIFLSFFYLIIDYFGIDVPIFKIRSLALIGICIYSVLAHICGEETKAKLYDNFFMPALMLYLPIFTDCFNNFENLDVHGWVNLPRADIFVTCFIVIGFFVIYLIPVINHNKTSDN